MPFEGFLGDARARPSGLKMFGHLVSLALHAPPVTMFAIAWLTRSLLVEGGAFDLPEPQNAVVYYQVPVALLDTFPGLGAKAGVGGGVPTAGGPEVERRGAVGPGKRRTRRPLIFPKDNQRVKTVAISKSLFGGDEFLDGSDEGNDGFGLGGSGGSGTGMGAGAGQSGPGGEGHGPGGVGAVKAPEPNQGKGPRKNAKGKATRDEESGREFDGDDEGVVGTPLVGRPSRISMEHAAYLRTYDVFPSPLPESCWPPGRIANTFLLEVCVTERGEVNEVTIRASSGTDADAILSRTIKNWRYRPRVVMGIPAPFCHPIRIVYKRELGFVGRF
jgi:hypothetical protein